MINLIKCECLKIKRYNIIVLGLLSVLFSVVLAAIQINSTSEKYTFLDFSDGVIWNNFSLIFPFTIVLVGGFLINREYLDNTLKSIVTIPISIKKLLLAKLIVTGFISLLYSLFSFICTLLLAFFYLDIHSFDFLQLGYSFIQIMGMGFFVFTAVSPLIILFTRKVNSYLVGVGISFFYGFCGIFIAGRDLTFAYPITAGLTVIHYSNQIITFKYLCIAMLILVVTIIFTLFLIWISPSYEKITASNSPLKKENTVKRITK
ncbi:ABC transporter permease [Enterococcus sp. DIV0876]|uniref:ABC transporter permease n=1 Tax=Enterococcus sp. DIV0876 TaxID=2774633 RepID=UPI003D2F9E3B